MVDRRNRIFVIRVAESPSQSGFYHRLCASRSFKLPALYEYNVLSVCPERQEQEQACVSRGQFKTESTLTMIIAINKFKLILATFSNEKSEHIYEDIDGAYQYRAR